MLDLGSIPAEAREEIERLRAQLKRVAAKGSDDVSYLGEVLSADVVRQLSAGKERKRDVFFRNARTGMHGDGGGLWFQVTAGNGRSWVFRHRVGKKQYEIGLGSASEVSLAEARARAAICRRLVGEGVDLKQRKAELAAAQAAKAPKHLTFKEAAEKYVRAKRAGWKGDKQEAVWTASLETYVYPLMGDVPVGEIDTSKVMLVLEQKAKDDKSFWEAMPETASRVRGRIEAVLDWAKTRSHRHGDNPARWRGHLEHQLPAPRKVKPVEHYAALPYADAYDFYQALSARGGYSAECLKFTILTACRSGESMGARWSEIDMVGKTWAIPASRTKTGREHRVPLSAPAIKTLEELIKLKGEGDGFVFPGGNAGKPLSATAMLMLLRKMGREDLTTHGFRSTFRDWAAETTNYANEVVEMALAHAVGSKVEASYRRGDMFERRRRLMDDWAKHCLAKPTAGQNVFAISVVGKR
jgi:integrase